MKRQSQGFSLIETMIAIAVLGIVAMSLLSFFSRANFYSSSGKDTHKADMVGQSVMEEINTYSDFEEIEKDLLQSTGTAWKLESQEEKKSILCKNLFMEGKEYHAKVTLDYDYPTGGETVSQFNNYDQPELKEIYSPSNVVLAESDQLSIAVSHFYSLVHASNPDTTIEKKQIQDTMTRDIVLEVTKDKEQPKVYRVRVTYRYHYDGKEFSSLMAEKKVEGKALENVYLLYNFLWEGETLEVNIDPEISSEETKKMSLYLVCQKGEIKPPEDYSYPLYVVGSGAYADLNYYTNNASVSGVSYKSGIVEHKKGKRIAVVTVDIYDAVEKDYTEENRIVRLQTSKGA